MARADWPAATLVHVISKNVVVCLLMPVHAAVDIDQRCRAGYPAADVTDNTLPLDHGGDVGIVELPGCRGRYGFSGLTFCCTRQVGEKAGKVLKDALNRHGLISRDCHSPFTCAITQ